MNFDFTNLMSYVQPQFNEIFTSILYGNDNFSTYVLKSGRSSGKSTSVAQALIILSFTKPGDILVVQSTYAAIKDASYKELCDWIENFGLQDYFTCTTSPLRIVNNVTGNTFKFRGCEKPEKLKGIPKITTIWFEEADLISKAAYDIVKLSMRSVIAKLQFILTFNPTSPFTWIKDIIDDPIQYKANIHHSYFFRNPFCNVDFIDEMRRIKVKDPQRFLRDGMGQFTIAEGLCINNKLIKDWEPSISYGARPYNFNGIDFGFNHLQAFVNGTYYQDTNILVLNEIIALSGLSNDEFIKFIPIKYRNVNNNFADSASPDKIKQLVQSSFKFKGAKKDYLKVANYIEFMNSLNAIVVHPNAVAFKKEAGKWEYIPETDTPRKVNDDINDAIRYGLQPILLERISSNTMKAGNVLGLR